MDLKLFGRIATLNKLKHLETDYLLVTTEKYKLFVISFDPETHSVKTEAMGDITDFKSRPVDCGQMAVIESKGRMIGLLLSQGIFKVIPLNKSNRPSLDFKASISDAFNVRLDKLDVISCCFVNFATQQSVLLVLYRDSKEMRHIASYVINVQDKSMKDYPGILNRKVEAGASIIIPVNVGNGISY
jgi:DNA damage-binding protein 1